jgi:hypothetical protein
MHDDELLSNLWKNREKENVRKNKKMIYLTRLYGGAVFSVQDSVSSGIILSE